jgi:hypothetical protein
MSGEVVYTPDGEAVVLAEMMRRFPILLKNLKHYLFKLHGAAFLGTSKE